MAGERSTLTPINIIVGEEENGEEWREKIEGARKMAKALSSFGSIFTREMNGDGKYTVSLARRFSSEGA